ncbi:MAG: flagellar motor protein [Proteobacteria bacterium]|nr:flagellar motor protein [Pseudomonadota bacterium]
MDIGSLAGITVALLSILLGFYVEGGSLGILLQPAGFLIVCGGTIGAVLLQTDILVFLRGVAMLKKVFITPDRDLIPIIDDIMKWVHISRKDGILRLEHIEQETEDSFIKRGLNLLIDGTPPDKLKEILEIELSTFEETERQAIKIWEAAAGYSPTLGILGAVLGLTHVMESLSDPSKIGSGIATAFISTVYGVALANIIFLPISNKLKTISTLEISRRVMLADAFFAIATGENRSVIKDRMDSYIG